MRVYTSKAVEVPSFGLPAPTLHRGQGNKQYLYEAIILVCCLKCVAGRLSRITDKFGMAMIESALPAKAGGG